MMAYTPPPFNEKGSKIFKAVVIGALILLIKISIISAVFYVQEKKIETMQKKIDRLENGISVFTTQDFITGVKKKYIPIGVATITDKGDKKGPVMPVLVSEDAYEAYKDNLRSQIMIHQMGEKYKADDE